MVLPYDPCESPFALPVRACHLRLRPDDSRGSSAPRSVRTLRSALLQALEQAGWPDPFEGPSAPPLTSPSSLIVTLDDTPTPIVRLRFWGRHAVVLAPAMIAVLRERNEPLVLRNWQGATTVHVQDAALDPLLSLRTLSECTAPPAEVRFAMRTPYQASRWRETSANDIRSWWRAEVCSAARALVQWDLIERGFEPKGLGPTWHAIVETATRSAASAVDALGPVGGALVYHGKTAKASHSNPGAVPQSGWLGHVSAQGTQEAWEKAWKWIVAWAYGPRRHHGFGLSRVDIETPDHQPPT